MHIDNFHYSILGQNTEQRIVFIHGLMAFAANWRKIATKLEDRYQCLIYDQRGHGRSFKPDEIYTPEVFAEDLNKITNELGWDSFHLVGHSMGGRVALVFAHLFPQKVKTLCIEDIGVEVNPENYKYYENMLNIVPTPFINKEEMKLFFDNEFLNLFKPNENPRVLITFLQANIEEKPKGHFDWKFSKQVIVDIVRQGHKKDRWLELSSLKMPILYIRGEKSHVLSQAEFEKIQLVNSNIQGFEIKGAGHWVHYEKYEEFTQKLHEFIQNNIAHNA